MKPASRRPTTSNDPVAPTYFPNRQSAPRAISAIPVSTNQALVRFTRKTETFSGCFHEADDPWLYGLDEWCCDFNRLCVPATIEQQTERGDKGRSLIERAIRIEPGNPVGYELLGGLCRKLGDAAKARDTFEEGLRVAKDRKPSPMYYVNLSEAYRRLKQPEEARQMLARWHQLTGSADEKKTTSRSRKLITGPR